jgi:hypothetical protein
VIFLGTRVSASQNKTEAASLGRSQKTRVNVRGAMKVRGVKKVHESISRR